MDRIEERWIIIIALHRYSGGSAFLEGWCHDLNVHQVFYSVMQQFRQESSHRVQLALLLVAYLIHFHLFGKVQAGDDEPRLLDNLSRRNCGLLAEAVRSYADVTGLEDTLRGLASPRLGLEVELPSNRHRFWEAIWVQFILWKPTEWPDSMNRGSDHYLKAETPHQSFQVEMSHLSVRRWQPWTKLYRSCLGSRR